MGLIEIEGLTYSYPAACEPALRNVSLQVEQGDFLAVVGNNGCGKSTLCKTLNGLIPHFIPGDFSGRVLVDGLTTTQSDVGTLACKVGYVYQDFENQIVRPTVLDDASYACMNYAMPDYLARGREAILQCGLSGRENDYIWQLSGGQTHLVALAGAVALRPGVLVLDEPIAQLDPRHADQVYGVLRELNKKFGKTIIVIEHHAEYIADYCRHVVLMKDGCVKWKLPVQEALRRVEELQECSIFPPQVTIAADRMQKIGKLSEDMQLPTTIPEGRAAFSSLVFRDNDIPCPKLAPRTEPAAEFINVRVSYRSVKDEPKSVLNGLNLTLYRGQKIAIVGSNGAGKTTLMKLMIGLVKPAEGDAQIFGRSVRDLKPENLSKWISLVYQNPEQMFIKDSIRSDIAYAMQVRGVPEYEARTAELLDRFRLTGLQERDGRLLSGGQMRRASLAIGIALNPQMLLLDEPTANLDIATRKEIVKTLSDMKHVMETVVIATHDMQLVCEWAERIVVLSEGTVLADGDRDEIFGDKVIVDRAGIRPPEIFSMSRALDARALCYTVDEFVRKFAEV